MPQNDKALLSRLKKQNVEFVIIGGVCGVLHGASLVTLDLDICCRFNRENLRRIEAAVKDLHPRHRLTVNKMPFELTDQLCNTLKNVYLNTDLGILDCLGEVSGIGGFEEVLQHSIPHNLSYGEFRMLNMDALIASKSATGREKDLAAIKLFLAIKERRDQQKEMF